MDLTACFISPSQDFILFKNNSICFGTPLMPEVKTSVGPMSSVSFSNAAKGSPLNT